MHKISPKIDHSDSASDSSIQSHSIEDKPKKRNKNRTPPNFRQASKKHKNRDTDPKLNNDNNLKLANKFSPIAPDDVEPDMEMSNEDEEYENAYPPLLNQGNQAPSDSQATQQASSSHAPKKKTYIPPIIVDKPSNTTELLKKFNELSDAEVEARTISADRLKLFPPYAASHREIRKNIKENSLKSHTFEPEDQKQLKVVIPADYPVEDILDELKCYQIKPINCHLLSIEVTTGTTPSFWSLYQRLATVKISSVLKSWDTYVYHLNP
ncbi:hypothetical protein AVEN_56795-1 [Araneus ventricosus]|uniref:Pre-C2HC domain-containing protein n=1 Tax=Araneus ventricosus TaxID=182803 RepID=A0A4Y2H942_ARAVE|nr:hypothetical protein AVEN_56795-1 [Araneus ventricosus]